MRDPHEQKLRSSLIRLAATQQGEARTALLSVLAQDKEASNPRAYAKGMVDFLILLGTFPAVGVDPASLTESYETAIRGLTLTLKRVELMEGEELTNFVMYLRSFMSTFLKKSI